MVACTTPGQLSQCLGDVVFPANKEDLLSAANRNGCNDETVQALRAIPSETFTSVAQVTASVSIKHDGDIAEGG